jgi:hypothetical protein
VKHRLATLRANAGFVKDCLILTDASGLPLPRHNLRHAPTLGPVRAVDVRHRLQQTLALGIGHAREHAAIGGDRFEQIDRLPEACDQRVTFRRGRPGHGFRVLLRRVSPQPWRRRTRPGHNAQCRV